MARLRKASLHRSKGTKRDTKQQAIHGKGTIHNIALNQLKEIKVTQIMNNIDQKANLFWATPDAPNFQVLLGLRREECSLEILYFGSEMETQEANGLSQAQKAAYEKNTQNLAALETLLKARFPQNPPSSVNVDLPK